MDNTIENVLNEMEKNTKAMEELVEKNRKLAKDLRERPDSDWDLVTVSTASKTLDIAPCTIYQRITRGQIKSKRICGKVYISLSDLKGKEDVEI